MPVPQLAGQGASELVPDDLPGLLHQSIPRLHSVPVAVRIAGGGNGSQAQDWPVTSNRKRWCESRLASDQQQEEGVYITATACSAATAHRPMRCCGAGPSARALWGIGNVHISYR